MLRLVQTGILSLFLLIATSPASAWLSLVRQGAESSEVPNTNDHFGRAVCAGDFDGDGFDDLAAAAPDEANGLVNGATHGVVIVNYGTSRGISHSPSALLSVGEPLDLAVQFGWSLCAADFDQDGDDDLVVGLPRLDSMTGSDRGAIWVYDGGPSGIQLAPYLQIALEDVEASPEDFANFGWALTSGDFNDDTYPDLCASAIGQATDTGVLYFFFGSPNGLNLVGSQKLFPFTVGGSEALGGRFGWSLAAADLDSMGGDDLVVGAPMTDVLGANEAGRVYFYYAGASGITGTGGWFLDRSNIPASLLPSENARLGFSVAAGHMFQTTGLMDVAVGAPRDDYGARSWAGSVLVFEFDSDPANYDSGKRIRQLTTGSWQQDTPEAGDEFGYALAVGKFDAGSYDDLAVGAPFEDVTEQAVLGLQANAGIVHVFYGQPAGPSVANAELFDSVRLNDFVEASSELGKSLCFGAFDASGKENLAVGEPGRDYASYESGIADISEAGQVQIVAPWRQPQSHPHRTSVGLDCDGFVFFGQRPFQRTRPASTTKTVTGLLACDAIEGGLDPTVVGVVPNWIATGPGGSQTPLFGGEKITFDGLMKTMMTVSGNDSAMLIGAILSGEGTFWDGWENTSPGFATMMESKVASFGLSSATSLTNAAGIDAGDHYVTALDWAILAHRAIQNDCLKTIVNTSPWTVWRELPPTEFNGMLAGPDLNQFTTTFYAGWVDALKSRYPFAVGIKPGGTPGGWRTGISAGNPPGPGGMTAASSFGTRRSDEPIDGVVAGCATCLHAELLELAEGFCMGMPNGVAPPPDPPERPWGTLGGIPTCPDLPAKAMAIHLSEEQVVSPASVVQVDLMRHSYDAPQNVGRLVVQRTSRVSLGPGENLSLGIAPHQENFGLKVTNSGALPVSLQVSWGGNITTATVAAESALTLAGAVQAGRSWSGSILNMESASAAVLDVEELGYFFEHTLGDGVTAPDVATMQLTRSGKIESENVQVFIRGQDPNCGMDTFDLVLRDPAVVATGVGDGPLPPRPLDLVLHPNQPNPFNPTTTLRFDLPRASAVQLAIYDVRGRRVRILAADEAMEAGRHRRRWDGRDDSGALVASGVYVARLQALGQQQSQRLVLLK